MVVISFTVHSLPVAQPRQRTRVIPGKPYAQNYTPTKHPVNAWKATVRQAFAEVWQGGPLDGPLRLEARFVLSRPQSLLWKTKPMFRLPHSGAVDVDNLAKSLLDALTELAWRNDGQVAELFVSKWVASGSESPHAEVTIEPLAPVTSPEVKICQRS